jgi:archaellum component FlaD/FlaE
MVTYAPVPGLTLPGEEAVLAILVVAVLASLIRGRTSAVSGALGAFKGLFGGDGEGTSDDEFGEPGSDEFGDLGGDEFGEPGSDEFGDLGDDEFGDLGGDEFGDLGTGTDTSTDELEKSVKDLEGEVGALSSSMNTVRAENEEIGEQVTEVSDQVRKLLDIYEMVTRGINPFVDDVGNDAAFGGQVAGDSAFGLFGADDDDTEEDVDPELMSTDADAFFDDDLLEEGFDDGLDDVPDAGDGLDDTDDGLDTGDGPDEGTDEWFDDDGGSSGDGGGKGFDELKAEFDAGVDWDDEDDGGDDADAGGDGDDEDDTGDDTDAGLEVAAEATEDVAQTEETDFVVEPAEQPPSNDELSETPVDQPPSEEEQPPDEAPPDRADDSLTGGHGSRRGLSGGKPYLRSLPGDYVGDLVVMEWLESLYDRGGVTEAARALYYYETVDWIAPPVTESLFEFLAAYEPLSGIDASVTSPPALSMDDHLRSLRFISLLATAGTPLVMLDVLTDDDAPAGATEDEDGV